MDIPPQPYKDMSLEDLHKHGFLDDNVTKDLQISPRPSEDMPLEGLQKHGVLDGNVIKDMVSPLDSCSKEYVLSQGTLPSEDM